MAAVGGLVVTVVTAVRMVWDWKDRKSSKAAPTVHPYTQEEMRAFLAARDRGERGQRQAQQGPQQPQDGQKGPDSALQQEHEPLADYERQEGRREPRQPGVPAPVADVPTWQWDPPPRRLDRLPERLSSLLDWLASLRSWAWWNAARLGAGLITVGAVLLVIGLLRG